MSAFIGDTNARYWIISTIEKNGGVENLSDEKLLSYIEITEDRIKKDKWYGNDPIKTQQLVETLSILEAELERRTN